MREFVDIIIGYSRSRKISGNECNVLSQCKGSCFVLWWVFISLFFYEMWDRAAFDLQTFWQEDKASNIGNRHE